MNKIYKVIWSKVKNQYVVVSELAHSNGKQSRTSRNSIRSRIAALVVCGAIAAFGVFSAVPNSAFAADVTVQQATQTQYVAFRADITSAEWRNGEKIIEGIVFRPQTIKLSDKTLNYWVREGYTLKATEGIQYIPDSLMKKDDVDGLKSDYAISAEITDQSLIKGSVLKTTESSAVGTTAMTTRNESLQKIEVGHYTGVSNSGGVGTGTIDWNYIIDPNGQGNVNEFIDIKDAAPDQWDSSQGKYVKDVWKSGYLKEVELRGSSYYLKGTNQEVASQNVYIIGDKAGAFVTTQNGSEIYTGRVYGAHNEILMTGKDENGNYYTYWAGKVNDDDNVLLSDSNLTLGDYKENVNAFYRNDRKLAAADIKSVKVDTDNNRINLITNTQFDENGKPIEGTEGTITGFTVTSVKDTGKDTKIEFSDGEGSSFNVDAGSRVEATKLENNKVSELSINGTKYAIGGGETYTAGNGIAIDDENDNKISVRLKDDETNLTVDNTGLALDKELNVTSVNAEGTTISAEGLKAGNVKVNAGNATITGLSNTTWDTEIASAVEANENGEAGYAATQGQLKDVADTAGTAEAEAKKHTTVKLADGEENLTLDEGTNAEGGKEYTVALDKELNVTSVNAEGTTISAEGLKAGNVKVNAGNATITGLSNTTWDTEIASAVEANKNGEAGYAATQGQLQKVSEAANEGWTAYINGFETEVKDIHPGNDYFSFNEGDNISITKSEDGNGIVISSDLTNLDVDDTNAVIYDNEGKTSVTLAGSSGTTITNLKAGQISATSTDAVNGSQLYATNQNITNVESKVNAGWTLYSDGKEVKNVHPGNNYLNINSGDNVTIETTDNGITISSNDTTLDVANSTSTPIGIQTNQGKEIYGQSFKIADTAGNVVTISDIASAKKLIEVDGNVDTLDEFAVKYDKDNEDKVDYSNVTLGGETYTKTVDENGEATYEGGTALKNVAYAGNVVDENGEVIGSAAVNVDYLKDSAAGLIAENNNLKVAADNDGDRNLNNWTITDTNQTDAQGKPLTFSNTTLDVDNSTSTPIAVAIGKPEAEKYGQTFKIADTAGNVVTISDIASAKKLIEVDQAVQNAQTEAGKHTSVSAGDNNLSVMKDKTPNENGGINYQVSLKDDITLGNYTEGTGVVVSGSSGTISATNAISVGVDPNNEQKGIVISSGKSDSIVGLDNIEWKNDADWQKDNIQADRAATEGQLQQATSTLTTNERHIATNGGDNPEAPNNKYTVQADGTVSLTEVNGDGTPTKNTVVLDNVATKTQQDINTDKLTHIEHYAVDDEGNTEGKDYTQVEGTKLYNDGSISSTVKDGWGMSSDTLTFDESGLTVSKETMGNGSGSTNISGDTIKTVDEYGNETTIDGGSVTTEDLTVNTENGNKLTFDSTGLNVNSGDTGLSVNKDGISLSVDNGAGKNSSVKVTQDGTEFSYSENGIADATTTTIKGSTITTDTVTGLNNTTWDDELAKQVANSEELQGTAATQGQLQQAVSEVAEVANAGWTASDGTNSISVKPNETLTFVGNENLTVSADGTDKELKVSLNDDITLGDGENAIKIDGTNGTLNIGNTFAVAEDGTVLSDGDVIADADGEKYSLSEVGKYAVRYDKTNDGTSTITLVDGDDLSGTRIKNVADGVDPKDAVNVSQLEAVEATANAGWTASDGTNSISVKPNETLTFVGDENLTVSADGTDKKLKVSLNDNITLGDGQSAITLNGSPQNSDDPALSVGTDKFVVAQDGSLSVSDKFNVDAETGNVNAVNSSGSAIMMNDDSVALNASGNGVAISDEGILLNTNGIDEDIKLVTKGTSVSVDSNGTTFTNTNTNETTNINGGTINVGDKLMVEEDGSIYATNNNGSTVMINDNGVALNSEGNGVVVSGEGITLNTNGSAVTVDRFNGTTFTNTNTGETTNINGGTITTNTIKGLSNTTWDDELAKQVANSEELQGTAATQGQLQQAVSEVAEVANAGWNAKAGGNTINVKPNETLNFEGDGNITVSATGGTSNELKFGLNDNITLGDKESTSITLYTDPTSETTVVGTDGNTTNVTGYVPESYKSGTGADFVKNNGGFALFTTDTQGHGIFGVTTKGTAHGKDFVTYTKDIYGNDTRYSLNDVGDAVTQMSSYYNEENGKSYTVFSRYLNEAEKDNPFATVDENATRDIPLALRDDGAVLIGATIKGDDFTDNGIRINAETETTYDENGKEVTNNIATITGLENTEWKPPTPVATFAANDINTTSRAATEAQLDDLYSAVAAYDVNVDGTIDYSHIALAGAPYGASRAGNGTPTGGTSITNVAYASGKDGSEAVNVDYLKDAISDAAENGSISTSDQHLVANTETGSNGVYKPNDDGNVNLIVSDEKGNSSTITIGDVASKTELDSLKTNVGDLSYSKVQGDDVKDGDSVTTAIGKLDNKIENISGTATDADNNTVTGGKINSDGTISLTQKDKDSIKLEGQLTDSGVVQEGTSFDKETGTITITSQDKYSGETSSVKVEGIASTEVVGATNKEDLATAYKDADKDGNATTEYITDSESMVEADVALDHAIQDVAGTSYANDMVLSNRIDSVEKRLGNVEERIDKVGAMAAAIANLRTMGFDPEAPTEIAIGVGQYKSETGIAIGVFHYPNQDFMLSASLSSSGDELMGGIGATWKLGRKSAAERAKDEEARHLEQAEEMKKLAQQEKVKAQAQRHAKLLAERQQASQKNA